jgi:hypothetical protein
LLFPFAASSCQSALRSAAQLGPAGALYSLTESALSPFHAEPTVLEYLYLGRYTHRVAISNQRLQKLDGQVNFEWKDYLDGQLKPMTLSAGEFTRRFLTHALPPGFQRYYGFLANCHRAARLKVCRRLLATRTAGYSPAPPTTATSIANSPASISGSAPIVEKVS